MSEELNSNQSATCAQRCFIHSAPARMYYSAYPAHLPLFDTLDVSPGRGPHASPCLMITPGRVRGWLRVSNI